MAKKRKKIVKEKTSKPKQLELGLKSPFWNFFHGIKHKTEKKIAIIEVNKYIKDQLIWFFTSFQAVLILSQLVIYLNSINNLPSLIPAVKYFDQLHNAVLSKYALFIFPVISLLIFIISLSLCRKTYFRNKPQSIYIASVLTVCILVLTMHLIRILLPYNG